MSFKPSFRLGHLAACLAASALAVTGCAPERAGPGDDDDDDDALVGTQFDTALFTVIDWGASVDYFGGTLVLVNQELGCADLSWDGHLPTWNLDPDADWVQLDIIHGDSLNGWLRNYVSHYAFEESGDDCCSDSSFFTGRHGFGPEDGGPDGPDEPPEPAGRGFLANLGVDSDHGDDLLSVTYSDDDALRGTLQTHVDDWAFDAEKCGIVDADTPVDPPPDGGGNPGNPGP